MRFHWGGIPEPKDFVPDETWKALREPNPLVMQLFAIPLGFVAFIAVGALWLYTTSLKGDPLKSIGSLTAAFASFIPLIIVHELIHAAVHPQSGKSNRTILGFWPSRLLFYAHYDGKLTRNRFVAILAMPTVVITFIPLVIAMTTNLSSGFIAWISTWNIFFACGDMFGIILLLFQVPSCAICHNQGWRTYWKISGGQ
jgi:Putative zincin peptidase